MTISNQTLLTSVTHRLSHAVRLIDFSFHWMSTLHGWRRAFLATFLGAVTTLALPPAHFVLILFVTFPGLLWLLDGVRSRWASFWIGWWFGFGYFVFGLYWIGFTFLLQLDALKWLLPLAVSGLPAYLAIYCGLATLMCSILALRGIGRCLGFAVVWTSTEWLRGFIFTGFPWNLIGSVWTEFPAILQIVSVTGIYGLSLITVVIVTLPATFAINSRCGVPSFQAIIGLVIGLALIGGIAIAGTVRLSGVEDQVVSDIRLRLVQPNIRQKVAWSPEEKRQIFWYLIGLTNGRLPTDGRHIIHTVDDPTNESSKRLMTIWPEAAVPFPIELIPDAIEAVAGVTSENGVTLVGTVRILSDSQTQRRHYNGLVIIDAQGQVIGSYNKSHLVPFGEYLPARRWFPAWFPIQAVATGSTDFDTGPGPQTLHLSGIPPFGPLICYEVIFAGEVTNSKDRPEWLVNITNDAWYRISAGPYQHFASAKIRAVEEGLPVVRVATTGISGIIDAYGRTQVALELGETGIIDADLPVGLDEITIYAQRGDWILVAILVIVTMMGIILSSSRLRISKHERISTQG